MYRYEDGCLAGNYSNPDKDTGQRNTMLKNYMTNVIYLFQQSPAFHFQDPLWRSSREFFIGKCLFQLQKTVKDENVLNHCNQIRQKFTEQKIYLVIFQKTIRQPTHIDQ